MEYLHRGVRRAEWAGSDAELLELADLPELAVCEYKEELHLADESRRMDAVKKVIAAMTVGKDMSSLFPDVVQSMQTTNVELKKLVHALRILASLRLGHFN